MPESHDPVETLNALRENQLEQAQEMHQGFTEKREDFAEIRESFAHQATGMAQNTVLLPKLADSEGHH